MSGGPYVYPETYERRKDALELAVKLCKDSSDDSDDTIEVAEAFLEWLLKPE